MNAQTSALDAVESFFAGIFSAAVIALVACGTLAMCLPGALGVVA